MKTIKKVKNIITSTRFTNKFEQEIKHNLNNVH